MNGQRRLRLHRQRREEAAVVGNKSIGIAAFKRLKLNPICADHMIGNPASGRMLAELGMKQEGMMRQCARKRKRLEDLALMTLIRKGCAKVSQD